MNGDTEMTLEAAKMIAAQAGLDLTDAEIADLLAGIRRTKAMAQTARAWLRNDLEPAPLFTATATEVRA